MELLKPRAHAQSADTRLYRSQKSVARQLSRINELQKTIDNQQNKLVNCLNDNLAAVSSAIQQLLDKPT